MWNMYEVIDNQEMLAICWHAPPMIILLYAQQVQQVNFSVLFEGCINYFEPIFGQIVWRCLKQTFPSLRKIFQIQRWDRTVCNLIRTCVGELALKVQLEDLTKAQGQYMGIHAFKDFLGLQVLDPPRRLWCGKLYLRWNFQLRQGLVWTHKLIAQ